ncbi:MAG: transposase [Trichodesmium sp. St11_bin5]|nr:transposase [Trichodesmium sp. St11_bin5]
MFLFSKVQALYWHLIGAADTIEYISMLLGRHRTNLSQWFATHIKFSIEDLLNNRKIVSKPKKISPILDNKLRAELEELEGFNSYNKIQIWWKALCDINLVYSTVYRYVYEHLKAK